MIHAPCDWTVQLVLLNVKSVVSNDSNERMDSNGANRQSVDTLAHVASRWNATGCYSAHGHLHYAVAKQKTSTVPFRRQSVGDVTGDGTWETIRRDVLKFVHERDRFLALASILLKSRAFHETYNAAGTHNSNQPIRRACAMPLIDLPRTRHHKPYIPLLRTSTSAPGSPETDATVHPFSLSHQFPFAGLARLVVPSEAAQTEPTSHALVGMDIVVFDPVNAKLYDSVREFCLVFKDYFSPTEWHAIQALDDDDCLRELYLRWAMKEAYTKALGVGMGCNFATFETRLDALTRDSDCIWHWLSSPRDGCARPTLVQSTARVVTLPSPPNIPSAPEIWLFYFLPLDTTDASPGTDSDLQAVCGCACVCIGPLASAEAAQHISLDTEWTHLDALMAWHGV